MGRPAVVIDPGRHFGAPRIDGTRVPAHRAADACWAGATASQAADQLGLDRVQVIVACWYVTRYQATDRERAKWRARWKAWADAWAVELGRDDMRHRVPDPPSPNRPEPEAA